MPILYIRGYIGLLIFVSGIVMTLFEVTRPVSWVAIGFGMGMMSSGFSNG